MFLWAFFPLLETHQRTNSRNFVFQGTVLLALASVFEIYTLFFIPIWWIGYSRMGGFNFKWCLLRFGIDFGILDRICVFCFWRQFAGIYCSFPLFCPVRFPYYSRIYFTTMGFYRYKSDFFDCISDNGFQIYQA